MQQAVWNRRQVSEANIRAKHKNPARPGRPPAPVSIPIDDVRELLTKKESVVLLVALKEVVRRTTLSKVQIYRMIAGGQFPKPVWVSQGRCAWIDSEINDWIKARVEARDVDGARPIRLPLIANDGGERRRRE